MEQEYKDALASIKPFRFDYDKEEFVRNCDKKDLDHAMAYAMQHGYLSIDARRAIQKMPGPDKEGQVFQAFGIDAAKVRAIIAKEDEAKEAVKEAGRYLEDFATQTKFPINISVKRAGKVNFGDKLTVDLNDYANPYSEKPSSAKSCLDALAKTLKDNWILTDVSVQNDIHHLTACAARAIGQPPAVEKNVIKEARSRYEEHTPFPARFLQAVKDKRPRRGHSVSHSYPCYLKRRKERHGQAAGSWISSFIGTAGGSGFAGSSWNG